MPDTTTALERLGVALLVGLLIGLDRERAEVRKAHAEFAGVRTFPLIALAGCVPMLLLDVTGPWLLVATFVAVAAIAALSYRQQAAAGHIGATTEVAALATFQLGMLAGSGRLLLAGAAGVVVGLLLVAKVRLEAFSRAITREELDAVLELLVISVIVLPLLPNRGMGPWGVLNPRSMWLVVVLVAGLSFVGFVATRLIGESRGLVITGAVGGLASSTAVTVAMAERSRASAALSHPAAAAAVLASTIMAARVAILAATIDASILPRLAPPLVVMGLCGAVTAWVLARADRGQAVPAGERLRNPFSLRQAIVFGAIYAVILLGVRAAQEYLGGGGVFLAAALGAIADVDAVTIAFTQLGAGESHWAVGAAAIMTAAVVNTVVKLGIGWVRGSTVFRRDLLVGLGLMAALGAAATLAVYRIAG